MPDLQLDNPENNSNVVIKENKTKNNTNLILLGLSLVIILLILGTVYLFFFQKPALEKKVNPQPDKNNTVEKRTLDYRKDSFGAYSDSSSAYKTGIENLQISDGLMNKIINEPDYLATLSSVIKRPDYKNLTTQQAKNAFKKSLTDVVDSTNVAAEAFSKKYPADFSPQLGKFLTLLDYIAIMGHSTDLSKADVVTWATTVTSGKKTAYTIVNLMGSAYMPTGIPWMENSIFNKPEFNY